VRRRRASLEGVRAKVRRAAALFDEFRTETRKFIRGHVYATELVDSLTTPGMLDVVVTRLEPMPEVIPLLFGTLSTISGLRSTI